MMYSIGRFLNLKLLFAITMAMAVFTSCSKKNTAIKETVVIEPVPSTQFSNNALASDLDRLIDSIFRPLMLKSSSVGLSIGILKNGTASFYGYGTIAKNSKQLPNENTAFEIGPISKTFTAAMIVKFLQEKGLTIEAPIGRFLPKDIPVLQLNGEEIKFKHLLNHTSGIPRLPDDIGVGTNAVDPYALYDTLRLYSYLKTAIPLSTPGRTYLYSNLGFGILSTILERNTQISFAEKLITDLSEPLALSRTRSKITEYSSNLSYGYDDRGYQTPYWDGNDKGAFKGAGSIYSTAYDLIRYAKEYIAPTNSNITPLFTQCEQQTFISGNTRVGLAWNLKKL